MTRLNLNKVNKIYSDKTYLSNNNDWPAFFWYKKNKYILKIFKSNKIN